MIWLRQSTAVVVSFGPAVLFSDGVTLVTNLVGTGANQTENTSTGIRIAKNGGAFAARHATATASTYDAFGNYLVTLDTTDTGTLGVLRMQYANASAFCPLFMDMMVVPAAVWDTYFASSGGVAFPTSGTLANTTNITAAAGVALAAGQKVDVDTIKTNPVVNGGTITFPTTATLASTTNITAGTIATATNVTTVNGLAANVITAASLAADAGAEIADVLLDRDMSTGADSGSTTVRTVRQALRFNRNKVSIAAGTMTVTKEDDSTSSWTAAVTTTAGDPITAIDPAGP